MGANQVGRNHAGLRLRLGLFARLRSASRALPAAASDALGAGAREKSASDLRETLSELAEREAPPEQLAKELNAAMGEINLQLNAMQRDLLERFDAIPFVSLRASVPRSVEAHRGEVIALLEVLLGDRRDLLERLPRVEYLITMLSTEEVDGRRNIVHDPVSLTPALEKFSVETFDAAEADSFSMELYQAATLDSESENFHKVLFDLRARKQSVGLACLCSVILRAVVTYNARMFNSVESMTETSRASDVLLEEALAETAGNSVLTDALEVEEEAETEGPVGDDGDSAPSSVFDSVALQTIIETVRARLTGAKVGRRGPAERIAIILDQGSLDSIEAEAISAEEPNGEQNLVARTTLVGLMLRDLGPIQGALGELGINSKHLSDAWVRELNQAFGQLISEKLADPKAYEQTSRLSGIKSKHLFRPLTALNSANRGMRVDAPGSDRASAEMRRVARAAAAEHISPPMRSVNSTHAGPSSPGIGLSLGTNKIRVIVASVLSAISIGLVLVNLIGIAPSGLKDLSAGSLRDTSTYLKSAYRNEKGRGDLLIGRVNSAYAELPIDDKISAAKEMVENFEIQGISQAMLYNSSGVLEVRFAAGELQRPRPGNRSTGRTPGESAVRRTLSGQRLDEAKSEADDQKWDDDRF